VKLTIAREAGSAALGPVTCRSLLAVDLAKEWGRILGRGCYKGHEQEASW
jgi:hypothetical protein